MIESERELPDQTREILMGRLEVARHRADRGAGLRALEELQAATREALGEHDRLVFATACAIEELRSRTRDVAESVEIWQALRTQAEPWLAGDDPTLMSIRSHEAQHIRKRGREGDLDAGIDLYREELARRAQTLGEHNYLTSVTRANVAQALRERGTVEDLQESFGLLRDEVQTRVKHFGESHHFTCLALDNLARTLIRLEETSAPGHESYPDGYAAGARDIANTLVQTWEQRFGRRDDLTLRAYVLRSYALRLCGRSADADRDLRYVQAAIRSRGVEPDCLG